MTNASRKIAAGSIMTASQRRIDMITHAQELCAYYLVQLEAVEDFVIEVLHSVCWRVERGLH